MVSTDSGISLTRLSNKDPDAMDMSVGKAVAWKIGHRCRLGASDLRPHNPADVRHPVFVLWSRHHYFVEWRAFYLRPRERNVPDSLVEEGRHPEPAMRKRAAGGDYPQTIHVNGLENSARFTMFIGCTTGFPDKLGDLLHSNVIVFP